MFTQNENLHFYDYSSADWEEEASTQMNLMIDHWITIRGFSHVAAYCIWKLTNRKIKREFRRPKGFEKKIDSNITFMKIYCHFLYYCTNVEYNKRKNKFSVTLKVVYRFL